jgi:hypothetical protein
MAWVIWFKQACLTSCHIYIMMMPCNQFNRMQKSLSLGTNACLLGETVRIACSYVSKYFKSRWIVAIKASVTFMAVSQPIPKGHMRGNLKHNAVYLLLMHRRRQDFISTVDLFLVTS